MASEGAESEARKKLLIVIIDDDDLIRNSTCRLLNSSGFQSEAFASAEDFLQSARIEETACLLLDAKMPGMSGLELQSHLTETGWHIPIIFVSARASDDEERRALLAGATGFLRKPTSKEALLLAITNALHPEI